MPSILTQFRTALVGISAANPVVGFVFSHWKLFTITFLSLSLGTVSFAAWEYHKYMTNKIDQLRVELSEYKGQVTLLDSNIQKILGDIKISEEQRKVLDESLSTVKKSSVVLRTRVNVLKNTKTDQTDVSMQQSTVDALRNDIANKWSTISEGEQK